ncbi:MAG: hypothetical protein FJ403_16445 [Verrucomicrobia bacterium]|nr:hypothetical protein [Verrucomicrobiota bacterium]
MRILLSFWVRGAVTVIGALYAIWTSQAAELAEPSLPAKSFAGVFKDDRIVLELAPKASSATDFTGTIRLETQTFPVTASSQNDALKGHFESQGDQFEFTAIFEGPTLVFTTDGTSYRLKKQSANPLARRTAPNPLSGATGEHPAETVNARSGTLYFVKQSIKDHDNMIGGEAFRMIVPAGWKVEGGVRWRLHPALPAYLGLRVTNPNGSEALEILPTLPFVWKEGGIPSFPAGSTYMGNEVREPVEEPVDFIKRVIVSRFRAVLSQARVIKSTDLPEVAEAIAANSQEPGFQKTVKAARVRFEYAHQGKAMHEDVYCVLLAAHASAINTTFWGTERSYSFRAEKGKLDDQSKLLQTVITSLRPNIQWFNRYMQLAPILTQNHEQTRQVEELSRYIVRTTDEINDIRRQAYENAQAAHERISAKFGHYIQGIDEYHNPFQNRRVELPSDYREVWANAAGEYILSDDVKFTPNIGSTSNWQRLEKKN